LADGPAWTWWLLAFLPLSQELKVWISSCNFGYSHCMKWILATGWTTERLGFESRYPIPIQPLRSSRYREWWQLCPTSRSLVPWLSRAISGTSSQDRMKADGAPAWDIGPHCGITVWLSEIMWSSCLVSERVRLSVKVSLWREGCEVGVKWLPDWDPVNWVVSWQEFYTGSCNKRTQAWEPEEYPLC
jgi:hypothetical protein